MTIRELWDKIASAYIAPMKAEVKLHKAQVEWYKSQTELESENKTERSDRKLAKGVINGGSL